MNRHVEKAGHRVTDSDAPPRSTVVTPRPHTPPVYIPLVAFHLHSIGTEGKINSLLGCEVQKFMGSCTE